MYASQLWCNFRKSCMQRLRVAYNFGCRALYNLTWRASVSSHQVQCNIPTFEALIWNYKDLFLERCRKSNNRLRALMQSGCLYSSLKRKGTNRRASAWITSDFWRDGAINAERCKLPSRERRSAQQGSGKSEIEQVYEKSTRSRCASGHKRSGWTYSPQRHECMIRCNNNRRARDCNTTTDSVCAQGFRSCHHHIIVQWRRQQLRVTQLLVVPGDSLLMGFRRLTTNCVVKRII